MPLDYYKNLIPRAKELRRDMTKQEKHLWYDFLSKYPVRFQRQKVINKFIADFYCFSARLIIELDGNQHYSEDGKIYDQERTQMLENYNLKVLRFSNKDVDMNFDEVCQAIDTEVKIRKGKTPPVATRQPPPEEASLPQLPEATAPSGGSLLKPSS